MPPEMGGFSRKMACDRKKKRKELKKQREAHKRRLQREKEKVILTPDKEMGLLDKPKNKLITFDKRLT